MLRSAALPPDAGCAFRNEERFDDGAQTPGLLSGRPLSG